MSTLWKVRQTSVIIIWFMLWDVLSLWLICWHILFQILKHLSLQRIPATQLHCPQPPNPVLLLIPRPFHLSPSICFTSPNRLWGGDLYLDPDPCRGSIFLSGKYEWNLVLALITFCHILSNVSNVIHLSHRCVCTVLPLSRTYYPSDQWHRWREETEEEDGYVLFLWYRLLFKLNVQCHSLIAAWYYFDMCM